MDKGLEVRGAGGKMSLQDTGHVKAEHLCTKKSDSI